MIDNMEDEIDLRELLVIMWRKKWLIALCVVIVTAMGASYTLFGITPVYESHTTLMVNNAKGLDPADIAASFDLGSIGTSQKLVVTYSEIVKSRIVLSQVINRLELDLKYGQLIEMIQAEPVKNTEILNITVTHKDPQIAADIANMVSDVFMKEVMRILKVNNVEIIDSAIVEPDDVNVSVVRNIAISIILGGMLGVFIVFVMQMMDNTMKTQEDVEKHLGFVLLGTVPNHGDLGIGGTHK